MHSICFTLALAIITTLLQLLFFFFLMIRRPPRSTLFPTRRSSDLERAEAGRELCRIAIGVPTEPEAERATFDGARSEEHTSELQSRLHLVCRLLLEKKKKTHK